MILYPPRGRVLAGRCNELLMAPLTVPGLDQESGGALSDGTGRFGGTSPGTA